MSGQALPGHRVHLVHVETLERALLDGVKLDGLQLDDLLRDEDQVGHADDDDGRMRVDLGLVPVFSDERPLLGLAGLIDWRGSGRLSALIRSGFCTAGVGEQLLLPCDRRLPIDRLVLVGLGERASFDVAQARAVAHQLVKISMGLQARSVLIALPTVGIDRALAEAMFEALLVAIEQQAVEPGPAEPVEPVAAAPEEGGDAPEDGRDAPEAGDDAPEDGDEAPIEALPDSVCEQAEVSGSDADVSQPPVSTQDQTAAPESPVPEPAPDLSSARWWVAVDASVVARLRRVLSGPPRAARHGTSLHT